MAVTSHHDKVRAYAETIAPTIEQALNSTRNQEEAAALLNEAGVTTYNGKEWTVFNLRHFRKTYLAD